MTAPANSSHVSHPPAATSAKAADRGHALPMVLTFTTFSGIVLAALMNFAVGGLRASTQLEGQRDARYAAAAVVDNHIEFLSNDESLGNASNPCPSVTQHINGFEVTVDCIPGSATLGRDLTLVAEIGGEPVLSAVVHIGLGSDPQVFVNSWMYA